MLAIEWRGWTAVRAPRSLATRKGDKALRPRSARTSGTRDYISMNHFVGAQQHRARDRESERLGSSDVDDELEAARLLDGELARLRALEDAVDVAREPQIQRRVVHGVRHQSARHDEF